MEQLIIHKILGTIKGFTSVSGNIGNPSTETVQKLQYEIIFTFSWRDCERVHRTKKAPNEMCPLKGQVDKQAEFIFLLRNAVI